jgi:hypothetical protein
MALFLARSTLDVRVPEATKSHSVLVTGRAEVDHRFLCDTTSDTNSGNSKALK